MSAVEVEQYKCRLHKLTRTDGKQTETGASREALPLKIYE